MTDRNSAAVPRFGVDVSSGLVAPARQVASPNWDTRPPDTEPDLFVVHCISLPPGEFGGGFIEALFCNELDVAAHPYFARLESLRVSAHFLIDRRGELTQFVPISQRAWHAGESNFQGRTACNDFSVGIELEGTEDGLYENAQYRCLDALVTCLRTALPSLSDGTAAAHADIAPGRKHDPGPGFDWSRVPALVRTPAWP
ncbi:MAG: 1,6-anhydro-N-acetylmuramyl-L-alanine amidase AmpD [Pseudomonadota bacterium]